MKYILLFAVLLVAYLAWRSGRRSARADAPRPPAPAAPPQAGQQPQDMVRCSTCAVHLPRSEALAGRDGRLYCSQEHRLGDGG